MCIIFENFTENELLNFKRIWCFLLRMMFCRTFLVKIPSRVELVENRCFGCFLSRRYLTGTVLKKSVAGSFLARNPIDGVQHVEKFCSAAGMSELIC